MGKGERNKKMKLAKIREDCREVNIRIFDDPKGDGFCIEPTFTPPLKPGEEYTEAQGIAVMMMTYINNFLANRNQGDLNKPPDAVHGTRPYQPPPPILLPSGKVAGSEPEEKQIITPENEVVAPFNPRLHRDVDEKGNIKGAEGPEVEI